MAKYKIVHYLNQFFGGIGGEDKADFQPEVREEIIGPGMALNDGLGDDYEIVATVICGDNYFGENLDLVFIYLGVENFTGNNLRIYGAGTNDIKWGDNPILHSGNYNSYAPIFIDSGEFS